MKSASQFDGTVLCGGLTLVQVVISEEPLTDAIGREALARAQITGRSIEIFIRPGLDDKEWSVTLYHEILEAMTVGCDHPPESVLEFNEGDFERAGYEAYDRFGPAAPESLNRMLQSYGFRGL
jgi:hypothetical protein